LTANRIIELSIAKALCFQSKALLAAQTGSAKGKKGVLAQFSISCASPCVDSPGLRFNFSPMAGGGLFQHYYGKLFSNFSLGTVCLDLMKNRPDLPDLTGFLRAGSESIGFWNKIMG
jgi:hypothetical protein